MASGKTILIAEDSVPLLKSLTVRLEAEGFKVIAVRDGYQALDKCVQHKPDLLILDVNMPAGSGLSVQERMNKRAEIANIPVVYVTGDTRESVMDKASALGAVALIHKPISTRELLNIVHSAIESAGEAA